MSQTTKNLPIETLCLCRVSSDKQAKNETITSQKQACLNYANNNGFKIDKFFYEDGVSGWKTNRPGLDAMVEYIEKNHKHKHIRILCYDMSRLARNMGVYYTAIENVIMKYDLELQTVVGGKSENNAMGRFMRGFDVLRAQMYSDELAEKTTNSMRALCTLGFYPLNPPSGLKRVKNEHKRTILVRDEPKASVIYQAFAKYASGELETKHDVTEFLRASGAFNNVKLNDTKVSNMLQNEVYTGVFAYGRWGIERREWQMDKIIPQDLFQAVQNKLNKHKRQPHRSDLAYEFPLRNEICCEYCGNPLSGYFARGRKNKHPYYRCYNKGCVHRNKSIKRALVEDAFVECLNGMQTPDDVILLFDVVLQRVCRAKDDEVLAQRKKWNREIETLEQDIVQFGRLVADANRNDDQDMVSVYSEQLRHASAKKRELEQQLKDVLPMSATRKFRTAMERGHSFFKNPAILWKNGSLNQRKRLVHILFEQKPVFCMESGFRTAATPWIFNKKSAQMDGKSDLAAPTGFEPVFSP